MAALSQGVHFPLTDRLIDCSRDALWSNNLTAVPVVSFMAVPRALV